MDRAAGVRRTSPAIARLRSAAPAAGYRPDRLLESLARPPGAKAADRPKGRATPGITKRRR
jgi:hypothetical protein